MFNYGAEEEVIVRNAEWFHTVTVAAKKITVLLLLFTEN